MKMYFSDHNHFELLDAVRKHLTKQHPTKHPTKQHPTKHLTDQLLHKHEQHHDPTDQLVHKHEQHHDPVSVHRLQRQRQGFQGNLEGS